ncbi:MAG: hypothetical protein ACI4PL_08520, partial [Faecousia sp.]
STGGLPHQRARWFAMTGNLKRVVKTTIYRLVIEFYLRLTIKREGAASYGKTDRAEKYLQGL